MSKPEATDSRRLNERSLKKVSPSLDRYESEWQGNAELHRAVRVSRSRALDPALFDEGGRGCGTSFEVSIHGIDRLANHLNFIELLQWPAGPYDTLIQLQKQS